MEELSSQSGALNIGPVEFLEHKASIPVNALKILTQPEDLRLFDTVFLFGT